MHYNARQMCSLNDWASCHDVMTCREVGQVIMSNEESCACRCAEGPEVHAVQTLTASLGGAGERGGGAAHQSLATVCRMTRTVLFPPQFKTLHEWFQYAFADSEIDGQLFEYFAAFIMALKWN